MPRVRLFIDRTLSGGETVTLERDQSHYLLNVMRMDEGDSLEVFDGRTGAYPAVLEEARRKGAVLEVGPRDRPLRTPPDLWLLFAPIKKTRTDFIVEKAAELGARRILPVRTELTNSERVRADRLQAHAVEAAEQCGGTFVPEVGEMEPLGRLLDGWTDGRALVFCDEMLAGPAEGWDAVPPGPAAILIGPEGGSSAAERARIAGIGCPVSLGPRTLRADTAAVAALTLWQDRFGDWR